MNATAGASASTEQGDDRDAASLRALRRYIAAHNRQALLLTFFSLAAAVFLWGLTYIFVYWFTLVAVTVSLGFHAETIDQINRPNLAGPHFPLWFAAGALVSLIVAGLAKRRAELDRLREASHYFLWVVAELLMAIPNVTFAIWGNLRAVSFLGRTETYEAWRLLHRINEEGGRLKLSSLRLEIEDEKILGRVVFTLQLVGLVGVRENSHGWFLCLQNREALGWLRMPVPRGTPRFNPA